MTKRDRDELLTEFLALYLAPFYDQTPMIDGLGSEWLERYKRYFEAHPERPSFVRKSYGSECSPCFESLVVNAFGNQTLAGIDWKFRELFKREPVRLVQVRLIDAGHHSRQAFYLGRPEEWTFDREWGCPDAIKLATEGDLKTFVETLQSRLPEEHDYCDAWLAEFFAMLQKDPVWNMRQFFRSVPLNSLVQ